MKPLLAPSLPLMATREGREIITCSTVYLAIKENDLLTEVCGAVAAAVQ